MEFWGVEVKAGEPAKVTLQAGQIIHISQAAMGVGKKGKGNDHIPLHVKIDGKKFVVGSLSGENFPQITFDLVFEKEFELSHDWKNGSVYFCGYLNHFSDGEDFDSSESDDDEDAPIGIMENGEIKPEVKEAKPASSKVKAGKPESSGKAKLTVVEPKKEDESDEDEDEDEDESEDEDMINASDDIGDSEDSDDEDDSKGEDEETPQKAVPGQKRPIKSATKTPVAAKKAKSDTPQKTDGKKGGGHTATPHPSKKPGKTPANSNKSKEQTPKSDGKVSCKSCTKTFNSGTGLESHTKAKHSGK